MREVTLPYDVPFLKLTLSGTDLQCDMKHWLNDNCKWDWKFTYNMEGYALLFYHDDDYTTFVLTWL